MAKKNNVIQKEKKPFDKTYIPLGFAILILILLVGSLVYTIFIYKPNRDKENFNPENTLKVEEYSIDTKNTTCNNDELNRLMDEAKKITAKYEEIDDYVFGDGFIPDAVDDSGNIEYVPITGWALRVTIDNLPDDLYFIVSNNLDDTKMIFNKVEEDKKSTVVWEEGETAFMRTYSIDVYSNSEQCSDIRVRAFDFTVPKWNELSKLGICKNNDFKDTDNCKHFIYSDKSFEQQLEDINKEAEKVYKEKIEKEKNKEDKSIKSIVDKNKYLIIIVIVSTILIVGIVVILLRKGRKNNEK